MPDLNFTPIFSHKDWVDNVDLIQAGGPNGFNIRMRSIESDLHQVSTVVGQIDSVLDQLASETGTPVLGPQLLNVPLNKVRPELTPGASIATPSPSPSFSFGDVWNYARNGALQCQFGGGTLVFGVTLPERIRLQSMRVIGRNPGTPAHLKVTLGRASLTDAARAVDTLVEFDTNRPNMTDPFDVTDDVLDGQLGLVDQNSFRYFLRADSDGADKTTELHAVLLTYVAV